MGSGKLEKGEEGNVHNVIPQTLVSSFGTAWVSAVANGNRGLCWGASSRNGSGSVARRPTVGSPTVSECGVAGGTGWWVVVVVGKGWHGSVTCEATNNTS